MKLKIIPTGNSKEDIKTRERIISDFYYEWKRSNPTQRESSILYNSDKDIKKSYWRFGLIVRSSHPIGFVLPQNAIFVVPL